MATDASPLSVEADLKIAVDLYSVTPTFRGTAPALPRLSLSRVLGALIVAVGRTVFVTVLVRFTATTLPRLSFVRIIWAVIVILFATLTSPAGVTLTRVGADAVDTCAIDARIGFAIVDVPIAVSTGPTRFTTA